jgi:hypothetical protein
VAVDGLLVPHNAVSIPALLSGDGKGVMYVP